MAPHSQPIYLQVPNDLTYLKGILALVREISEYTGFDESDRSRIELAVEEAFTNEVRHSFADKEYATFGLTLIPSAMGLEIRFTDTGRPLNPARLEVFDPERMNLQENPKGIGSFLIKRLMDTVEYSSLGNKGKMLRMIKYHRQSGQAPEERPAVPETAPPPSDQPLPPIAFTIRRLTDTDTFQVTELAYDTYGYSYLYEHIYFPERISALNLSDELISMVAVTPDGEVAGHVAMVCDPALPGLGELGLAMVKPKFRGYKLLERISGHCIEEALNRGISGMFVQATTAHTYSQPVPRKAGMKPVGFILGYISAMNLKNIDEAARERVTPVVAFKFLHPVEPFTLFLPALREEKIRDLLAAIGAKTIPALSSSAPKEQSVFTVTVNTVSLLARVIVYETGSEIVHVLKQVLSRAREESLEVVELLMNLEEPLTAALYSEVEALGFIFTGVLPGSSRGTFITLVYLNGINIHFENIRLIEDNGQELLEYIRKDYEQRFLE